MGLILCLIFSDFTHSDTIYGTFLIYSLSYGINVRLRMVNDQYKVFWLECSKCMWLVEVIVKIQQWLFLRPS